MTMNKKDTRTHWPKGVDYIVKTLTWHEELIKALKGLSDAVTLGTPKDVDYWNLNAHEILKKLESLP